MLDLKDHTMNKFMVLKGMILWILKNFYGI